MATYSYADNGRRTGRTLGDTPGTSTTWTYGRDDNLPTAISAGSSGSVASFSYTYDANKNKLTEALGSPMANYGFDSTTYDNEDRLTYWQRVDRGADQSWSLSDAGDWDTFNGVNRTHNDVHELTAVGGTSLTHDYNGNLTKDAGQTYQKYRWDFDNRMTGADTDDDDTEDVEYTYDALGRRVSKTVLVAGGGGGSPTPPRPTGLGGRRAGARPAAGTNLGGRSSGGAPLLGGRSAGSTEITTVYINTIHPLEFSANAGQEVAEYKNTGTGTSFTLQKKFVYADYIDEPVVMVNVDGETETKYYYHANSLYSVAALTNQSGTVIERYSYTAYGKVTYHNADGSVAGTQASTVGNPYLFTGRRLDSETGLQYSRARYYDFELGRFIGRDPIGYWGGINLYEYVGGRPLVSVDPTGYDSPFQYPGSITFMGQTIVSVRPTNGSRPVFPAIS